MPYTHKSVENACLYSSEFGEPMTAQSSKYTCTVDVRLKVSFRFGAMIVAQMYGFGFGLVLSLN